MILLKLGGSLITDKNRIKTPRHEVISRIADEIGEAFKLDRSLRLLLGHGSGSFGHPAAERYQTQKGASTRDEWLGFAEVWATANELNRILIDVLREVGLPAIAMPPSASVMSQGGSIEEMAVNPLKAAIDANLLPVVQGDVAFDVDQGAAIISTEEVFAFIAPRLQASLILLAGIEEGVYADYPDCTELLNELTEENLEDVGLNGSAAVDVTGGMAGKVVQAIDICRENPGLQIRIFSGERPGMILSALTGDPVGTLIRTSSSGG
ncbi:MAG: uridylate kinase [Anaerolineales bacterium]|nr:uridylate kinase [Anaerolineales bacterium]